MDWFLHDWDRHHEIVNELRYSFTPGKTIEKKYREKINSDIVNREKLFDRSADHK